MKVKKQAKVLLMMFFFASVGMLTWADHVYAKQITSVAKAQELALQKVKNATVIDAGSDHDDGVKMYEVTLVKGTKKYEITYRASDGKMLAYGWEKRKVSVAADRAVISKSKCEELAQKQVKNGEILSLVQKLDDGIDIYKVKLATGSKKYTLKYHARTGALIGYEWEVIISSSSDTGNGNISMEKAKQIALEKVPGATVIKAEYDVDDGVPVYEVELVKGMYEYEYKIHAKTGNVIEYEKDLID